jgi:hypothetical protein
MNTTNISSLHKEILTGTRCIIPILYVSSPNTNLSSRARPFDCETFVSAIGIDLVTPNNLPENYTVSKRNRLPFQRI